MEAPLKVPHRKDFKNMTSAIAIELKAREVAFLPTISGWDNKTILTVMSMTNSLLFSAASRANVLKKVTDGWQVLKHYVDRFLAAFTQGGAIVELSLKWLRDHIKINTPEAFCSPQKLRQIRQMLSEMGLFRFTQYEPGKNYRGNKERPKTVEFSEIDLLGLFALHCACERELIYREGDMSLLPEHRFYLTVMLYNAIALKKCYGRKMPIAQNEVPDAEEVEAEIERRSPGVMQRAIAWVKKVFNPLIQEVKEPVLEPFKATEDWDYLPF